MFNVFINPKVYNPINVYEFSHYFHIIRYTVISLNNELYVNELHARKNYVERVNTKPS